MLSFSQARGLTPIRTVIQKDSVDSKLRISLWNLVHVYYMKSAEHYMFETEESLRVLLTRIWLHRFGGAYDEIPSQTFEIIATFKKQFLNDEWFVMYDLLQFIPNNYKQHDSTDNKNNSQFIDAANKALTHELSAYRFVGTVLTDITSEEEIDTIEQVLQGSTPAIYKTHINRALELYSDKDNRDYRNSIKESISALETLCRQISGMPNATLPEALNKIDTIHKIHPVLKKSISNLYAYSGDESGVRHGLKGEDVVGHSEAKLMLVSCSAFINYILEKFNT